MSHVELCYCIGGALLEFVHNTFAMKTLRVA